jgi:zinc/manganese transport system ATP-binding protein
MRPVPGAVILEDLTIRYGRHPAIESVSGAFRAGSLTAIVGRNGSGKSTLLKAIAGTLRAAAGRILRQGDRPAFLPQQSEIERSFPIRVADAVSFGRLGIMGWFRAAGPEDLDAIAAALDAVGLAAEAGQSVATISTGQFQRMLFARLMLEESGLILLDEPFTALDGRTEQDLLEIVLGWHRAGRTIVAVLHDLDQVRRHFPETLLLAGRAIGWGATAEILTPANLTRARRISDAA